MDLELVALHSGECSADHPCRSLSCTQGAECVPDEPAERGGGCVCPACAPVYEPICGPDAVTYHSLCHLRRAACLVAAGNASGGGSAVLATEPAYWGPCIAGGTCDTRHCPPHAFCRPSPPGHLLQIKL